MTPRESLVLYMGSVLVILLVVSIMLRMAFRKRFGRSDLRLPPGEPEDWRDGVPQGWRTQPPKGWRSK